MNNKGSGLTPAQALDKLDALYEQSVVALRNAIGNYITSGELPDENATCNMVASVVGGGFTPFIAAALITYFAGNWHSVAIYLLAGCLISAMTALLMKDSQRA